MNSNNNLLINTNIRYLYVILEDLLTLLSKMDIDKELLNNRENKDCDDKLFILREKYDYRCCFSTIKFRWYNSDIINHMDSIANVLIVEL